MPVGISAQQEHFKKQIAGSPHRGRAAKPRQNELGEEKLHLKQQEGAQENGQREGEHSQSSQLTASQFSAGFLGTRGFTGFLRPKEALFESRQYTSLQGDQGWSSVKETKRSRSSRWI